MTLARPARKGSYGRDLPDAEHDGVPVDLPEPGPRRVVAGAAALRSAGAMRLRRQAGPADGAARRLPGSQRGRAVTGLDLAVVAAPHAGFAVVDEQFDLAVGEVGDTRRLADIGDPDLELGLVTDLERLGRRVGRDAEHRRYAWHRGRRRRVRAGRHGRPGRRLRAGRLL